MEILSLFLNQHDCSLFRSLFPGITVFATSMTSIFGPLIRGGFNKLLKGNNHTMHRKDHFIVCGHSILAINTILQLNQRGQNVTVISNLPEDDIKQLEQRLGDNADVIPGDSNDSSVLKKRRKSIDAGPFWR